MGVLLAAYVSWRGAARRDDDGQHGAASSRPPEARQVAASRVGSAQLDRVWRGLHEDRREHGLQKGSCASPISALREGASVSSAVAP